MNDRKPLVAGVRVRPRFGALHRRDGSVVPLVFYPTSRPNEFVGRHAGSEAPVRIMEGDRLSVDVLGPGQSVILGGA